MGCVTLSEIIRHKEGRSFTNRSGMMCADGPWSFSLPIFGVADKLYRTTLTLALHSGCDGGREVIFLDYNRLLLGCGGPADHVRRLSGRSVRVALFASCR